MTGPENDNDAVPEHGRTDVFQGDEALRDRIQRIVDQGGEAALDEEDFTFAVQHGLIGG